MKSVIARVEHWLSVHFGQVALAQSGARTIAALPFVYESCPVRTRHLIRDNYGVGRYAYRPFMVEACADSKGESLISLKKRVEALAAVAGVNIYRPKPGQDLAVLRSGKIYECVLNNDPLHCHGSLALIDFNTFALNAQTGRLEILDEQVSHTHYLDPNFA